MRTLSTSALRTLTGLLVILGLLAGCGTGEQGQPDGSLDGLVNPDGLRKLEFATRQVGEFLADVTLNESETEVVACNIFGEVIFYDAETLEEAARVQLQDEQGSPDSYCRIQIIEGKVYAYYGDSNYPEMSPARMVMGKVDLATRAQEALWRFPSHRDPAAPYNDNGFGLTGRFSTGLELVSDGSRAVFTLGAGVGYSRDNADESGVDVPFLDLENGELTMERRLDLPGNYGINASIAYDGHSLVSQYQVVDGGAFAFVFDLDTNQLTLLEGMFIYANWREVNEDLRTLIGGGGLSTHWWVMDLDTFEILGRHENLQPGWCEDGTVLSRTRVALAYSFNDPPSILGVMDMATGQGLASAWIPEEALQSVVKTRDSRRVYLGGLETLTRVEIPEELLQ